MSKKETTVPIRATETQSIFLRELGGGTAGYGKHPKGIQCLLDRYFAIIQDHNCPLTYEELQDPELMESEKYQELSVDDRCRVVIMLDAITYHKCRNGLV